MDIIRWGILSTSKIGREQLIPAIQKSENGTVSAISSRSATKAKEVADELGIPNVYGSYDALLADPEIDAIYNPLPNHLHVPKTIEAMKAGKHVLCEKPIALDAEEVQKLKDASMAYPDMKVMEAFMYRFHPQWKKTKSLVQNGAIGELQTIESFFSYYNEDPDDIRNKPEMGGGALMDIGCYCISLSRYLFDREPVDVTAQWKVDQQLETDYLSSGILDFSTGNAIFSCSTQAASSQWVNIVGTDGLIVMGMPFNAPADKKTRIWLKKGEQEQKITFDPVNQYTLQAEAFADSIINDSAVPTPLEDAINNMKIIDAFRRSAREQSS